MLYTIDMDDHLGVCNNITFPLMTTINSRLSQGGPVASDDQEPWVDPGIEGPNSAGLLQSTLIMVGVHAIRPNLSYD